MNNEKQLLPEGDIFKLFLPKKVSLLKLFSPNFKKWKSWTFDQWVRFTLLALLLLIFFFTGYSLVSNYKYIEDILNILSCAIVAVTVLNILRALLTIVPRQLFQPERELLESTVSQFPKDLQLARFIARSFDKITIEFAQQRFVMLSEHLTQRISLMLGIIETIGLIPMGITAYLAFKKLEIDGFNLDLVYLQWVGFGVVFLYFVAYLLRISAQEFLRHSQVLKLALDLKQQDALNNS